MAEGYSSCFHLYSLILCSLMDSLCDRLRSCSCLKKGLEIRGEVLGLQMDSMDSCAAIQSVRLFILMNSIVSLHCCSFKEFRVQLANYSIIFHFENLLFISYYMIMAYSYHYMIITINELLFQVSFKHCCFDQEMN